MRLRCAILDDFQDAARTHADWSPITSQVELVRFPEHFPTEDELAAALTDFEIIVTLRERVRFPASLFARLPRLRLLVASGMRNSVIDLAAANEYGVTVCGTTSSSVPPAELTFALMLGLARQLIPENTALRASGPWQTTVGTDLNGACLGLLGLGKIGRKVADIAVAFGMQVMAWSPNLTSERAAQAGAEFARSKEELLASSDFVSIHLKLGERSRGLIGAAELDRMKSTAYLINTSRAAIVDQDALLSALRDGTIAGAGIDVHDREPLPPNHPMRTAPRLLATPHLGYVTHANFRSYYGEAVEDIQAFLAGSPVRRLS